jgi:hypothetical protein
MISTKAEQKQLKLARERNLISVSDPEARNGEVTGIAREVTPESRQVAQMDYVMDGEAVLLMKPTPELPSSRLATHEGRIAVEAIIRRRIEASGSREMRRLENQAAHQRTDSSGFRL